MHAKSNVVNHPVCSSMCQRNYETVDKNLLSCTSSGIQTLLMLLRNCCKNLSQKKTRRWKHIFAIFGVCVCVCVFLLVVLYTKFNCLNIERISSNKRSCLTTQGQIHNDFCYFSHFIKSNTNNYWNELTKPNKQTIWTMHTFL